VTKLQAGQTTSDETVLVGGCLFIKSIFWKYYYKNLLFHFDRTGAKRQRGLTGKNMQKNIDEFLNYLFSLPSLREDIDFFEGESDSLLCMDLLFNQRVGVERATSAALSIHYHFGKPLPLLEKNISEVTKWPYEKIELRRPAKQCRKWSRNISRI